MGSIKHGLGAVLFAGAAAWSGQAPAVNTENYDIPYVAAMGTFAFPDSARDNDLGYGYHILIGVPLDEVGFMDFLGDGQALELNFFDNDLEREIDGKDNYQTGFMADWVKDFGLYGWPKDNPVVGWLPNFKPFVLVGLGVIQDDVLGDKHSHFGLEGGGGVIADLPWWGWALRADARIQGQVNDESAPGHDFLVDYRINIGVQIPLTPFFDRSLAVKPPEDCPVRVVDPVTGRSDCAADSDRDGVPDTSDKCPGTAPGSVVDGSGCGLGQALLLSDVRFALDSAELTPEAKASLDGVAQTLGAAKGTTVEVGGHTDDTGGAEYNLELSQKRANAVRDYLVSKGVDGASLTAVGYGNTRPLVSNVEVAGREMNRRVELKITSQSNAPAPGQ